MRFLRQGLTGLVLAALTLGLLVYAGEMVSNAVQQRLADDPAGPPQRERVFAVRLVTAEAGTHTPVLETYGEVIARRTLEVRAAVAGRVLSLSPQFANGGRVGSGDTLVEIDPADAQSALARLKADLADATAEVRDAARGLALAGDEVTAARRQADLRDRAFQRQVDLADRGVGTSAAIEDSELAAAAARAVVLSRRQAVAQADARVDLAATRLDRARIALAEAERTLADTRITAPFAGTLSNIAAVEGGLVSVNERLADLIDTDDLEVAFRVSNGQYARLVDPDGTLLEAPVTASLAASGQDLEAPGRLERVGAETGAGQTGRLLFARLERVAGFRPGDFVTVRVAEPPIENVVELPASALGSEGAVLVLSGADRLDSLSVTLLRRQGDTVLVRGVGLDGREVVTSRSPLLGPGIAVRPIREDAQAQAGGTEASMMALTEARRAELMALVRSNDTMPQDAKDRVLARLAEPSVPAEMVARIERRRGG